MKIIESPQNTKIKELKKLSQKKYRDESSLFLVENLAIICDALDSGFDCLELYLTDEIEKRHKERVEYLKKNSKADIYKIDNRANIGVRSLILAF